MPTILIADDEENIRRVVRLNLEAEGYSVIEAGDGEEALRRLEIDRPEILILDVRMPKLDGLAVLRQLQTDSSDVRVLMLTGATDEEDYLRGLGAGAVDYIAKPFEPEDLVGAVEQLLNLSPDELQSYREREIERARLLRQLDRFLE